MANLDLAIQIPIVAGTFGAITDVSTLDAFVRSLATDGTAAGVIELWGSDDPSGAARMIPITRFTLSGDIQRLPLSGPPGPGSSSFDNSNSYKVKLVSGTGGGFIYAFGPTNEPPLPNQPGVNVAGFGATASVVTAAPQNIPVAGSVTSTTATLGSPPMAKSGTYSVMRISYEGNVANILQTIAVTLAQNGVLVAAAVIDGLGSGAGTHTGFVTFAEIAYAPGDTFNMFIEPSAALAAVLTDVTGSIG